jgi:hypothetical protein
VAQALNARDKGTGVADARIKAVPTRSERLNFSSHVLAEFCPRSPEFQKVDCSYITIRQLSLLP